MSGNGAAAGAGGGVASPDEDLWERDVPCPVCASGARRILNPDAGWGGYAFVACEACGMRYYSPRYRERFVIRRYLDEADAAREEATNLFEKGVMVGEPQGTPEEQKAHLGTYYRFLLGLQEGWFSRLNDGRLPKTVLEVGSSVGWFLDTARSVMGERGDEPRLAGIDANPHAAAVGREKLDLDVFGGTFQDYPARPDETGFYDLVTALDYIEHTYTPAADLRRMYALARPGAILMLKTFSEDLDTEGSYIHPIFHANHFPSRSLREVVEQAGWRIVEFDDVRERVYAQVSLFAVKPFS